MKFICRKPGPKSIKILERDQKIISPSLTREYSFVFSKAKGCNLWDVDGRKYLDFAAAVAVVGVGHSNPEVIKAIKRQVEKSIHVGFADFYAKLPVEFVEQLLTFLPTNMDKAFLSNSGTEAIEAGYKLARWHTKKKYTIAFEGAFHGRTMGSLSMTKSRPVQRDRYSPFLPVMHTPFANPYRIGKSSDDCTNICLGALEKKIKSKKGDIASLFMEPVQGEGGYIIPPKSFAKGVRKLCDEHSILLVADEVQSGCYRTGKFLAIDNFNVKPDIVCLSKAIGGGVPLGATLASKEIMDWVPGSHANTFGGNLLACAAGIATLKYMRKKKLGKNATRIGKHMMNRLNEMKDEHEIIGDVRGLGLMIGVEIVKSKKSKQYDDIKRKEILCSASEKGLILLPAGRSTIRICPPLIITKEQADLGLDILEDSIDQVGN